MKPLKVALIVKNTPSTFRRDNRGMGMWSYSVPEFEWEHIAPGKGFKLSLLDLKARGFDLVFHEDGGAWGDYLGTDIPVIYYAIDSTLSEEGHYKPRLAQALRADLILVDHDRLERFDYGIPVKRLSYCVNDRLFYPRDKTIDVAFHCGSTPERSDTRRRLADYCARHGLVYVSGTVPLEHYADDLGRAKVVVNLPRTPTNRPHRVFDTMASGAALVTYLLPQVSGEFRREFMDYVTIDSLEATLDSVLPQWHAVAETALETARKYYYWSTRAKKLREMIRCALSV